MGRRLIWAIGTIVFAWLALAAVRGWQVGADLKQVAPYLYAPLLIVAGGWLGRWAGNRFDPRLIAKLVIVAAAYLALAALLTNHPGRGAIGYANANAAFAVQLMAVAGLAALHRRSRWHGVAGVAIGCVALLANASQAGTATGLFVLLAIIAALTARRATRRWLATLIALGVVTAAVAVLVSLARRTTWPERVLTSLHEVRQDMWNAAWDAFRHAEAFGLGPGGYTQVNPWAHDADTISAHSLPLQVAAELGGAGLALLTLLFLCGLAIAARAHAPQATWIAIAAWTALFTHAVMDHLVEYWPIPLAAGLVLGYALVAQPKTETQDEVV